MNGNLATLALIGDRFHNSDYIRTALTRTLGEGLGLAVDFTDETGALTRESLSKYGLLIVFRDAWVWPDGYGETNFWQGEQHRRPEADPFDVTESTWYPGYQELRPMRVTSRPPVDQAGAAPRAWMSDEQARAVTAFVRRGNAALFYHNVTYIARENGEFKEVLGAATLGHPPIRPHRVRVTRPDHPIASGVSDFVVTDEQHFLTYDGDPDAVFMETVNEDGLTHENCGTSCAAGWAHDFGEGRVCYLAPGHTIPALWNPEYVKIQRNAVRWLRGETG